jgi:hypothetical protein
MTRLFLVFEAASFLIAALIHSGLLVAGYEHERARVAEGLIAAVLLAGLLLTWIRPARLGSVGFAAQGFALLGTLIGVFTIAIGVGPRTLPDVLYHVGIVIVLALGMRGAARARRRESENRDLSLE